MAELVDALASGASIRKDVEVRVLFWAPNLRFILGVLRQDFLVPLPVPLASSKSELSWLISYFLY